MQETPTVACTLTQSGMTERRRRWQDVAARAFVRRVVTDRGLQLVFRADSGVEDELRELALLERDCCAFARWNVTTEDAYTVLDVTAAGDAGLAAVQQMFRTLRPWPARPR
jgi:hypothetical protein